MCKRLQAPFLYHDGRLSVAFQSTGYYTEQEEPEVPRLKPLQLEALRTVQALALDPELSIHFLLQPGDIQLLHNTTVLHGREGFLDGEVGVPSCSQPWVDFSPVCRNPLSGRDLSGRNMYGIAGVGDALGSIH